MRDIAVAAVDCRKAAAWAKNESSGRGQKEERKLLEHGGRQSGRTDNCAIG
jgi:hypothetical protein